MMQTYRVRLYPTRQQEKTMGETLETCRLLYNELLDDRIQIHTGVFEQKKALTKLRKQNKYLKQVYSQVLQDVAFRLDKAYGAFFAGLSRYPKFKKRGHYNSLTYPQRWNRGGFDVVGARLRLSMIGRVRFRPGMEMPGTKKTCTIIKDIDQWYACITSKLTDSMSLHNNKPPVGIDMGTSSAVTTSDETILPAPKFLKESEIEIRRLQISLSRKKPGSRNRERAKVQLARAWRGVRNRRNDFAHKTSRLLAENYSTVVFEDLAIVNMVKNHSLASAILDACWGKLRRLTVYKAERRGGRVILVEPRGTSQECSRCGNVVPKDLSERMHRCTYCGLELNRDVNAARNILARGLERTPAEAEQIPVRRIGKFSRGSKKLANVSH